jgi:hypothetical protein
MIADEALDRPSGASWRLLGGLCLALLGATLFLSWLLARRAQAACSNGEDALRDPEIQLKVVQRLAEASSMPFDSHPDGEVGRV